MFGRFMGYAVGWTLLLLILAFCPALQAQDPVPAAASPAEMASKPTITEATDPTALVRQLGDDSFPTRLRAAEQLTRIGIQARDALLLGINDSDPHVRRQCRWLLSDILEAEAEQRLQSFLAYSEPQVGFQQPGWDRYSRIAGDDMEARKLYIQMLTAESGLLEAASAGPAAAADALAVRLQQIQRARNSDDAAVRVLPSLETTAALLLIASDPQLGAQENTTDFSAMLNIIQLPEFYLALLQEGPMQPIARKLLGQWIMRPGAETVLSSKLSLALNFDLKEGLAPALRLSQNRQLANQSLRAQGIGFIGKWGGKDYAAVLDVLLDDKGILFQGQMGGVKTEIQIRDVALAWLIHVTGQDHAEYGMTNAKANFDTLRKNPSSSYIPSYTDQGFREATARELALIKWRSYVAVNPLPKLPPEPRPVEGKSAGLRTVSYSAVATPQSPPQNAPSAAPRDKMAPAERSKVQILNMIRELFDRRAYGQAMRLLDDILAAETDLAFQLDITVPLYHGMKSEARRMLSQMPPEAHDAYHLQFELVAQRALGEAVRSGDIRGIMAVSERFFYLPAGADATYLIAASDRDRGHPLQAAMLLERLRDQSADAGRLEPALSRTLASLTGDGKTAGESAWPLFHGNAARNGSAQMVKVLPHATPLISICDDPNLRSKLEEIRDNLLDHVDLAMPSMHPLVVGDMVLLRTATHLVAMDPASGKIIWHAAMEDPLKNRLKEIPKNPKILQSEASATALRRRFTEDLAFGTLSSDGSLVFALEDISLDMGSIAPRLIVGADGLPHLDSNMVKNNNLLTAYDVRTGKLKWEIGGPPGLGRLPLAGDRFLGPPLPLAGRLYVVAEINSETLLLELNALTGELQRELSIVIQDPAAQAESSTVVLRGGGIRGGRVLFSSLPPNPMYHCGSSPSYADGVLVFYAGARKYAAIDLSTHAVLWVYEAPEKELLRYGRGGRGGPARIIDTSSSDVIGNHWMDDTVTIAGGRVLLTPPESDDLICLSLTDGQVLWKTPRKQAIYIGGVEGDVAVMIGFYNVWKVSLADGTTQSVPIPSSATRPSGRGLLCAGRYLLPLSSGEIMVVNLRQDLTQGRTTSLLPLGEGVIPGNLVAWRDVLLSQNVDNLWRLDDKPPPANYQQWLEQQMDRLKGVDALSKTR
jgi:outer membrane protein assembly factor BamB